MRLINSDRCAITYNLLRQHIEGIPFDSALYDTWLHKAALMCYDASIAPENMKPVWRLLLNTGEYKYFYDGRC